MRILVTGASGLLGRAAVAALRDRGFDVVTTSRRKSSDVPFDLLATEPSALIAAAQPTHVLHAAWTTAHPGFWTDPANTEWVAASRRLVEAAYANGVRRLVGVGTCAEYLWPCISCDEVLTPLSPATPYAIAKDTFHRLAATEAARTGREFAWARVFFAYGPGEPAGKLVSSVLADVLAGRTPQIRDPGKRFDFIYTDDVGRGLAQLTTSASVGVFNIGSGTVHSVREVAEAAAAAVAPSLTVLARETHDDFAVGANIARAKSAFGFAPTIDLTEGIARLAGAAKHAGVIREP